MLEPGGGNPVTATYVGHLGTSFAAKKNISGYIITPCLLEMLVKLCRQLQKEKVCRYFFHREGDGTYVAIPGFTPPTNSNSTPPCRFDFKQRLLFHGREQVPLLSQSLYIFLCGRLPLTIPQIQQSVPPPL